MLTSTMDKKNCSYATRKLTLLRSVSFKTSIPRAKTLIFIHPPKTGGTNLVFVAEVFEKKGKLKVVRFPVPRVANRSPNLITEGWVGGWESAVQTLAKNPLCCQEVNFISGHFPVGLHEKIGGSAQYLALIRHPVDRSISAANFDFQRGYIQGADAVDYMLKTSIDNPQTRLLAGVQYMQGPCDEDMFNQAKKNVEEYFFLLGITEDTDSFIQILSSIQGWGKLALTRAQVTGEKIIEKPDADLVAKLMVKHAVDMRLYQWVKERWLKWKQEQVVFLTEDKREETDEGVMCIPYDYAHTRETVFLSESGIKKYNEEMRGDELVEVSQVHRELELQKDRLLGSSTSRVLAVLPVGGGVASAVDVTVGEDKEEELEEKLDGGLVEGGCDGVAIKRVCR